MDVSFERGWIVANTRNIYAYSICIFSCINSASRETKIGDVGNYSVLLSLSSLLFPLFPPTSRFLVYTAWNLSSVVETANERVSDNYVGVSRDRTIRRVAPFLFNRWTNQRIYRPFVRKSYELLKIEHSMHDYESLMTVASGCQRFILR